MASGWKKAAADKLASVNSQIPQEWRLAQVPNPEEQRDVTGKFIHSHLSAREIEITETDAAGIFAQTSTGAWKSLEVIQAFSHRAALAQQLTNCLLEMFFEAAYADARELDEYWAQHQKPRGPLHGVPVSLKDQFHVKGVETTMGYVGWIGTFQGTTGTGRERTFESEMVRELRAAGALLYCKTSVPHSLMFGETFNNITGTTLNPKNRHLSCGGSSGGEGALIGLKGSPLGLGTDIGGSIRIPAAYNGLYGLRPTTGRLPYGGMANSMDGQNSVLSVVGPLATSAASLALLARAVLAQKPWEHDPLVLHMPWRDDTQQQLMTALGSGEKLAFAVLRHDGVVGVQPPVRRALERAVDVLRAAGHEIHDWTPPVPHQHLADLALTSYVYDGGADVHRDFALSGESRAAHVSRLYGEAPSGEATASQIAKNNVAIRDARTAYIEHWTGTKNVTKTGRPIDAIVCPVSPWAACPHDGNRYFGYTSVFNVLDYTAVVVPVTTVDKTVDVPDTAYTPIGDTDKWIHEQYDPELLDGAHVSIQLVGRRHEEEKMCVLADYAGKLVRS